MQISLYQRSVLFKKKFNVLKSIFFVKKNSKVRRDLCDDFESGTRALLFLFLKVKRFLRDTRRVQQKAGSKMLKP